MAFIAVLCALLGIVALFRDPRPRTRRRWRP